MTAWPTMQTYIQISWPSHSVRLLGYHDIMGPNEASGSRQQTFRARVYRMLKGLFFISGLRGLIGRAKRSSSASRESGWAAGRPETSPCRAAFRDMGAELVLVE